MLGDFFRLSCLSTYDSFVRTSIAPSQIIKTTTTTSTMNSFVTTLIAALALLSHTAVAQNYVTTKSYSDSSCSTLVECSTADLGTTACVAQEECTSNEDGDAYVKITCATSITADMGDGAYILFYAADDTTCSGDAATAYGGPGWETCAITATSESATVNCDTADVLTVRDCSDETCTTCDVSTYATTCTLSADSGAYYKAVCGTSTSSTDDGSNADESSDDKSTTSTTVTTTTDDIVTADEANDDEETCFSGNDVVSLASGATKMLSEVHVGDEVLTANANGDFSYAAVVIMPHEHNTKETTFMRIETSSGKSIQATKMHLLHQCDGTLAYAGGLNEGDCLLTVDGNEVVTAVTMTMAVGIYTAVTANEYLVVNGIVASSFAVSHGLVKSYYSLHFAVAAFMPSAVKSTLLPAINIILGGAFLASAGK